jgi:Na+/phosphate symporter
MEATMNTQTSVVPERLRSDARAMSQEAVEMLRLAWESFAKQTPQFLGEAEKLGRELHRREQAIIESALGARAAARPDEEHLFVPMHLERIGDNIELLVGAIRKMLREGIPFTDRAIGEMSSLFEKTLELLEGVRDLITINNRTLVRSVIEEGERFEVVANDYGLFHQQRLIEGVCLPKSSSVYLAMLDYLKAIEWHTRQVARKFQAARGTVH